MGKRRKRRRRRRTTTMSAGGKCIARLACGAAALAKSGTTSGPNPTVWRRFLNVHEYQGAKRMGDFGVNVPPGIVAFSVPEAVEAAKKMDQGSGEVVVKSQILAGGRGLGTFKSGLQGGVHICKTEAAEGLSSSPAAKVALVSKTSLKSIRTK